MPNSVCSDDSASAESSVEFESDSDYIVLPPASTTCLVERGNESKEALLFQRNGLPWSRATLALGLRSATGDVVDDHAECPDCEARKRDGKMKLVLGFSGQWVAPKDLAKNENGGLVPQSWDAGSLLENHHWVRVLKDPEEGVARTNGVHYEEMDLWQPGHIVIGCCPRCPRKGFVAKNANERLTEDACQVRLLLTSPGVSCTYETVSDRPLVPPETIPTPRTPTP